MIRSSLQLSLLQRPLLHCLYTTVLLCSQIFVLDPSPHMCLKKLVQNLCLCISCDYTLEKASHTYLPPYCSLQICSYKKILNFCKYIMLGLLAKVYLRNYFKCSNHNLNKKWFATNYTTILHVFFMISQFYDEI